MEEQGDHEEHNLEKPLKVHEKTTPHPGKKQHETSKTSHTRTPHHSIATAKYEEEVNKESKNIPKEENEDVFMFSNKQETSTICQTCGTEINGNEEIQSIETTEQHRLKTHKSHIHITSGIFPKHESKHMKSTKPSHGMSTLESKVSSIKMQEKSPETKQFETTPTTKLFEEYQGKITPKETIANAVERTSEAELTLPGIGTEESTLHFVPQVMEEKIETSGPEEKVEEQGNEIIEEPTPVKTATTINLETSSELINVNQILATVDVKVNQLLGVTQKSYTPTENIFFATNPMESVNRLISAVSVEVSKGEESLTEESFSERTKTEKFPSDLAAHEKITFYQGEGTEIAENESQAGESTEVIYPSEKIDGIAEESKVSEIPGTTAEQIESRLTQKEEIFPEEVSETIVESKETEITAQQTSRNIEGEVSKEMAGSSETTESSEVAGPPEEVAETVPEPKVIEIPGTTAVLSEDEISTEKGIAVSSGASENLEVKHPGEEVGGTVTETKETEVLGQTATQAEGGAAKEAEIGRSSAVEGLEATHPPMELGEISAGAKEGEQTQLPTETAGEVTIEEKVTSSLESSEVALPHEEVGETVPEPKVTEIPGTTAIIDEGEITKEEIAASAGTTENLKVTNPSGEIGGTVAETTENEIFGQPTAQTAEAATKKSEIDGSSAIVGLEVTRPPEEVGERSEKLKESEQIQISTQTSDEVTKGDEKVVSSEMGESSDIEGPSEEFGETVPEPKVTEIPPGTTDVPSDSEITKEEGIFISSEVTENLEVTHQTEEIGGTVAETDIFGQTETKNHGTATKEAEIVGISKIEDSEVIHSLEETGGTNVESTQTEENEQQTVKTEGEVTKEGEAGAGLEVTEAEVTQIPDEIGGIVAESKETEEPGHTADATDGEITKEGQVGASSEVGKGSKISQTNEEMGGTVAESKETEELEHTAAATEGKVTKEGETGATSEAAEGN
uniref:Uncharacterized protein n=1 Tax=Tenebrio molitor TaxID=7067 RepID=A0A8J6H3S3_TENMO|nr:hypothetical protein GEV33_015193 [Tenebrio molitor]